VREVQPIMCFLPAKFSCFFLLFGFASHFEISFDLNGYFLFTTTTQDSVNVKNLRYFETKTISRNFFQHPSHFLTDFEGLSIKVNLNQIQKYFGLDLLGPKPIFEVSKLSSRNFDPPY
jgi:hypothetical protein